jgi:hypothetical protein
MNISHSKQIATISLQTKPLGLKAGFQGLELVSFAKVGVTEDQIRCELSGDEVQVIKIRQ